MKDRGGFERVRSQGGKLQKKKKKLNQSGRIDTENPERERERGAARWMD